MELPTKKRTRFHSISFPSEWGHLEEAALKAARHVSIQLVSPASGDPCIIHPRQRKVSRGRLRGSDLFLGFHTCVRSKKNDETLAQ